MPDALKIATFYVVAASAVVGMTTMFVLSEVQRTKRKFFK